MVFLIFHTKKGNKEANTQGSSESEKKTEKILLRRMKHLYKRIQRDRG